MRECVLVHNFDGVDVKGGGGGAFRLAGGALAAGDSLTLKSGARELSCCCLTNSELYMGGKEGNGMSTTVFNVLISSRVLRHL